MSQRSARDDATSGSAVDRGGGLFAVCYLMMAGEGPPWFVTRTVTLD